MTASTPEEHERRLSISSCGDSGIASTGAATAGQHFMESKSVKAFRTNHDYLYAMTEDLAEWLNFLYDLSINVETFFDDLENGVVLCTHAGQVQSAGEAYFQSQSVSSSSQFIIKVGNKLLKLPQCGPKFRKTAKAGTFMARDNIAQFITWCRLLGIPDCILFETEDLVLRKNTKHVILCLLEIARVGSQFGMEVPELIQLEQEIDAEMSGDSGLASPVVSTKTDQIHHQSIKTPKSQTLQSQHLQQNLEDPNATIPAYQRRRQRWQCDMKSLDELVRELVSECSCDETFPMKRLDEGKYLFGDNQMLIFVRVLRNHVMVRVGGGWDSLEHLLYKHDPCRKDNNKHHSSLQSGVPVNHQQERKRKLGWKNGGSTPNSATGSNNSCCENIVASSETVNHNSNSSTKSTTQSTDTSKVEEIYTTKKKLPTSKSDDRIFSNNSASTSKNLEHQFVKPTHPAPARKASVPHVKTTDRQHLLKPDSLKHRTNAEGVQKQGMMNLTAIQKNMDNQNKPTTTKTKNFIASTATKERLQRDPNQRRSSIQTSTPSKNKDFKSKKKPELHFRQDLEDLKHALKDLSVNLNDSGTAQHTKQQDVSYSDLEKEYIEFEKSLHSKKGKDKTVKSKCQSSANSSLTNGVSPTDFDQVDKEMDSVDWCKQNKCDISRPITASRIPGPLSTQTHTHSFRAKMNRSCTPQSDLSQSAKLARKTYSHTRRASISHTNG